MQVFIVNTAMKSELEAELDQGNYDLTLDMLAAPQFCGIYNNKELACNEAKKFLLEDLKEDFDNEDQWQTFCR